MENLKKIFDIRRVSFILIVLPYLLFHRASFYSSPFFTYGNFGMAIVVLIAIEMLLKYCIPINKKVGGVISLTFAFLTLLFIYGILATTYFEKFFYTHFGWFLRGRITMLFCLVVFSLILYRVKKIRVSFRVFNVFLLIFAMLSLFSPSRSKTPVEDINAIANNFKSIPQANKNLKPVIFIITDEYSSPDALFNVNKDKNTYNFSNKLVKSGWLVRNNFYTYEGSTIHSLSSLFNYNLSKGGSYSKQNIPDMGVHKLLHASMADSLKTKKVSIINYGMFNIGMSKPLNPFYFIPANFLENILMFSSYNHLISNTGGLKFSGFAQSYYPTENIHNYIFDSLNTTAQKIGNPKTFIYVHLLMPHAPFQFNPEFPIRKENTLENYEAFWQFTNKKLEKLLADLTKENKYKIILTGDHGFRSDKRIDFHHTFGAFYGFDQSEIDQIESVQDLGSLINASF